MSNRTIARIAVSGGVPLLAAGARVVDVLAAAADAVALEVARRRAPPRRRRRPAAPRARRARGGSVARELEQDGDAGGAVVGADEAAGCPLGVVVGADDDRARARGRGSCRRTLRHGRWIAHPASAGVAQLRGDQPAVRAPPAEPRRARPELDLRASGRRRRARRRSRAAGRASCSESPPPRIRRAGSEHGERPARSRGGALRGKLGAHGSGAHGPAERARRLFPHQRGRRRATCTSAAICIFEGPPPSYDDLLDHVRSRLHLVPRFRQKLAYPPAPTGRPFWVDDPAFNIDYHVRHSALPSPGSEEQLRNMAARVFSQQLDRTKPLWELWMVQGLTRKRFAFVTKTHHALVDGVSGRRHRDRAVRRQAGARARRGRATTGSRARALRRPARSPRTSRGSPATPGPRAAPDRAGGRAPAPLAAAGRGGGRGARRGRLELRQPGAGGAAERAGRLAPAIRVGARRPGPVQADQERARRDGQRRRARRRRRRAARLAARARRTHRGPRAARAGPGLDPRRGRARPARQPDRRDARTDPGLRRRTRSSDSRSAARAWRGSSTRSRRSAPR